jgi:hypothetical protein
MDNLEKAFSTLAKVKLVLYTEVPAGKGMCDENDEKPAQREYHCIADTPEGLRCVASIYAVDSKVLSYHPYAPSGCCSSCCMLDGMVDGQAECNALLVHVVTRCPVRESTQDEYDLCHKVAHLECGCHQGGPDQLLEDLEKDQERISWN